MSSTVSVTGSRYRAILLQDKTMLRRSKFGVLRGLPNSEASEDPGASLDNVCTSSPRSPVPCEGSWNDPVLCKAIPGQNEGQTTSRIQVLNNFESKNASAVIILPTVQSFSNRKFVNPFELLKFHLLTNKDKHKLITQKKTSYKKSKLRKVTGLEFPISQNLFQQKPTSDLFRLYRGFSTFSIMHQP